MAAEDVEDTARELRLVVGQLVRRVKADTAGAAGLPGPQVAVLGWLDRDGAMTTAQLAAATMVRHQSASRVVSQLASAGLVLLKPHPTDGRKQLVAVTAGGRRALARQRDQRAGWLADRIADRLSPGEQRTLAKATELLGRLVEP
jgi:DNA-binding MarR family transcriptional regulator